MGMKDIERLWTQAKCRKTNKQTRETLSVLITEIKPHEMLEKSLRNLET